MGELNGGIVVSKVNQIGGVNWNAPLFNGATEEQLESIVSALSTASYHYADDSGGEWGAGGKALKKACATANDLRLGHYAMQCVYRHTSQMVGLDRFVDGVLADARAAPKVKALEWITPSPTTDGQWQDMNGLYDIEENILFIGHVETGLRFDSEADAKAAAQAHYNAMILGALE